MYLVDEQIKARLPELRIQTEIGHLFEADSQVQPCSIDLRLSPVYWRPRRRPRKVIDLTRSRLLEVSPRRNWDRHELGSGESLSIRPGELVLGRVYEHLTIPDDCAGALEGRSSFARMGLSVHATGGFINPGWSGHMPLTLVNNGVATLRLPGYLPICQLMLVALASNPSRTYGAGGLRSKYLDDDGGPSYWWRDKVIGNLLAELGRSDVILDLQERLLQKIGVPPDDVLERLELFVAGRSASAFGNVDELLEGFVRREDRKKMYDTIIRRAAIASLPVMLSATISSLFVHPIGVLHYIVWIITALTIPFAILAVRDSPSEYLGRRELAELERRSNQQAIA